MKRLAAMAAATVLGAGVWISVGPAEAAGLRGTLLAPAPAGDRASDAGSTARLETVGHRRWKREHRHYGGWGHHRGWRHGGWGHHRGWGGHRHWGHHGWRYHRGFHGGWHGGWRHGHWGRHAW